MFGAEKDESDGDGMHRATGKLSTVLSIRCELHIQKVLHTVAAEASYPWSEMSQVDSLLLHHVHGFCIPVVTVEGCVTSVY